MPPLAAAALLYQLLGELQLAVLHPSTLLVTGGVLAAAGTLGILAWFGGRAVRVIVMALVSVVWLDAAIGLAAMFEPLTPAVREAVARDRRRLADVAAIDAALERHIREVGPLPTPAAYGEHTGPPEFWRSWWDTSTHDGNGDGRPFLEFLVDRGLMTSVPVDPINEPPLDQNPGQGQQYAFLVVPAGYAYAGGHCGGTEEAVYMLGVTDLERQQARPTGLDGSGCDCLWREQPDFFSGYFDYVLCGVFRP